MTRQHPLFASLLSLILVFGSVLGSVARNQMAGVANVTLCDTGGAAVLQVDALGNPVKPRQPCPHCLAASTLATLSAPPPSPRARAGLPRTPCCRGLQQRCPRRKAPAPRHAAPL